MGSLFLVLAAIVIGMNVLSYMDIIRSTDEAIKIISDNGGTFPSPMRAASGPGAGMQGDGAQPGMQPDPQAGNPDTTPPPLPKEATDQDGSGETGQREGNNHIPFYITRGMSAETPYETRYFTIYLKDGQITGTHMDNIAAVSEEEALQYGQDILSDDIESGFMETKYRYKKLDDMIIFVDCGRRLDAFSNQILTSIGVSLAGLFIVFILVFFTSKLIFKPVEESEKKQKQFLTDASHELKTPLAIIEANTEVIEIENGESKWTDSTRHQIQRLTDLVEQLIALTRLGETDLAGSKEEVALSEIVAETVEGYEASSEISGKEIKTEITENIVVHANEKNIRSLLGLLMDNAIKYSLPETTIEVSLKAKGKKAILEIYNKADNIKQGDNDILFERFYRTDASRNSETGGSGIGLSVARSIVESFGGKIHAYSDDGNSLRITVIL
jgi:signal transduction histidine kinase